MRQRASHVGNLPRRYKRPRPPGHGAPAGGQRTHRGGRTAAQRLTAARFPGVRVGHGVAEGDLPSEKGPLGTKLVTADGVRLLWEVKQTGCRRRSSTATLLEPE